MENQSNSLDNHSDNCLDNQKTHEEESGIAEKTKNFLNEIMLESDRWIKINVSSIGVRFESRGLPTSDIIGIFEQIKFDLLNEEKRKKNQ